MRDRDGSGHGVGAEGKMGKHEISGDKVMHAGRGQESIGIEIRILTLSGIRLRPQTGVIKLINIAFIKILTEPQRGERMADTTLIISHIKPQICRNIPL